jgi:uncharacterized protein with HEPN domain
MMQKDDSLYLRHILDAISTIGEYLTDIDYEKFSRTQLLQDGVIRQFEIIGEATKNLSQDVRQISPKVPWKSMAGMRDKLIHQYFGVDIKAVWLTAQDDLPELEKVIRQLLVDFEP